MQNSYKNYQFASSPKTLFRRFSRNSSRGFSGQFLQEFLQRLFHEFFFRDYQGCPRNAGLKSRNNTKYFIILPGIAQAISLGSTSSRKPPLSKFFFKNVPGYPQRIPRNNSMYFFTNFPRAPPEIPVRMPPDARIPSEFSYGLSSLSSVFFFQKCQ